MNFSIACRQGNLKALQKWVDAGAHFVDLMDGITIAIRYGHIDVAQYLSKHIKNARGFNHLQLESHGNRLLEEAIDDGFIGAVECLVYLLIENGAKIREDFMVLEYASDRGNLALVKYLVEKAHIPAGHTDALEIATRAGHLDIIEYLFEQVYIPIDSEMLWIASSEGHLDIVRYLVERVGIDAGANEGRALTEAKLANRHEVIAYLRKHGARKRDGWARWLAKNLCWG